MQAVDRIARETAAKVKGVTYVDAHTLFADANGDYQQSFVDELGERHVMRAGDGVHFSVDGADYIGRAIFKLIDQDWDVTAQADPTHPQPVKETKGSTQVPGTHRSVSSSSSAAGRRQHDDPTTPLVGDDHHHGSRRAPRRPTTPPATLDHDDRRTDATPAT